MPIPDPDLERVPLPPPPSPHRRLRLQLELEADDLDGVASVFQDLAALATIGPFDPLAVEADPRAGTHFRLVYADAGPEQTADAYRVQLATYRTQRRLWEDHLLGRTSRRAS